MHWKKIDRIVSTLELQPRTKWLQLRQISPENKTVNVIGSHQLKVPAPDG